MNKLPRGVFVILLLVFLSIFNACKDGFEDYSSNPDDLLVFSRDTVAFDTIITTINTPFQAFMVYNLHTKPLLISSVYLENGEKSGFKINVDGKAGSAFENIEIRGKDSLFVFVDAKPAKNNSNTPEYVTDYVVFVTNGIRQRVLLEASTQDAVIWKGLVIDSHSVLSNAKPFVIYDSLVIKEGITAEIKGGTTFYMHSNAVIIVRGTLKIKGALENPVVIRGDRFDYMVNIPYDLIPGQWSGIRFESNSYNNELDYVYIRNGKFGMDFKLSDPFQSKLKMKNVVMTNFKGVLLNALNCNIEAENCEFSNSQGAVLNLTGGQYNFTHCTIANYYFSHLESGWGNSDNETVRLSSSYFNNETEKIEYYPVLQANFYNSIIWGKKNLNSSKITIEEGEDVFISYYFRNCLIPNDSATNDDVNDPNIVPSVVDCLFDIDPKFKVIAENDRFYDFRLDSVSPMRNKANPDISKKVPYDINGISRFLDEGPDIGGYEYK